MEPARAVSAKEIGSTLHTGSPVPFCLRALAYAGALFCLSTVSRILFHSRVSLEACLLLLSRTLLLSRSCIEAGCEFRSTVHAVFWVQFAVKPLTAQTGLGIVCASARAFYCEIYFSIIRIIYPLALGFLLELFGPCWKHFGR